MEYGDTYGAKRSIVDRMRGAAMLDVATYEEVENDLTATGQAGVVVAIVAVCTAIGGLGGGLMGIVGGLVSALLGWLTWAGVTYFVGTRLFGGTATWGELLRTLGFAQSPGILLILGIIPLLGKVVWLVVGIWMLATGFIAIRQALDVTTGKALLTALVSWLAMMIVKAFFAMLGVGVALGMGALR
jgi:hypothetical protein